MSLGFVEWTNSQSALFQGPIVFADNKMIVFTEVVVVVIGIVTDVETTGLPAMTVATTVTGCPVTVTCEVEVTLVVIVCTSFAIVFSTIDVETVVNASRTICVSIAELVRVMVMVEGTLFVGDTTRFLRAAGVIVVVWEIVGPGTVFIFVVEKVVV
ncbi:hypothetical protein B0J14DRAFT_606617 [Halenospora varia]|nr:hypothetical protein B0J14DRAFT_606617 [Halenospora varia]